MRKVWAFDAGLWSLTDSFRVLVADRRFHESGPDAHLLKPLASTAIRLPRNPALHPDPRHLAWHRKRHGFASSATG